MVTFRTVDPLFVNDLLDPQIRKFSARLENTGLQRLFTSYDENHIIGFGKDTVEIRAMPTGHKICTFDVTDVKIIYRVL